MKSESFLNLKLPIECQRNDIVKGKSSGLRMLLMTMEWIGLYAIRDTLGKEHSDYHVYRLNMIFQEKVTKMQKAGSRQAEIQLLHASKMHSFVNKTMHF